VSAVAVLVEHDRGELHEASREALTVGRSLAAALGAEMIGVVLAGDPGLVAPLAEEVARYGGSATAAAIDAMLADYGPEAWGEAMVQAVATLGADVVIARGTDRGNEVMAQFAARRDLPLAANCIEVAPGSPWRLVRTRWGGSLLEEATLEAPVRALTIAHHSVDPRPADLPAPAAIRELPVALDPSLARSVVVDRELRDTSGGATLATARVVVGGGRGVGSAEGFSILEELASLLEGRVGCSRAVTNNGWRNHTDQVGQTGTRIAPDIYLACGISGAIQHWVGAMASKKILAINTDPEANMVSRADYAVIGDLHQVVPAISAEIRRRRNA
jgi:electron transfer flavoprotein alpha subunit